MKEKVSVPFMLLGILFNVCLIAANLLETKVIQVGSLTVTAGLLVFPISYIINDGQTIEDPIFNENIMSNAVLRQNMKKILNRTEFRILDCDSKLRYEIAQHDSKVDFLCSVQHSAQGGPQLLPNLRLEEEFFILKDKDGNVIRESASVLHKTARTLIGLKTLEGGEQEIHIFIVTNEHPMDIYESSFEVRQCVQYKWIPTVYQRFPDCYIHFQVYQ